MLFDIRTLLVTVGLASAICAGARFLLWSSHRHLPGLLRWALAGACGTVALLLIALHDTLPPLLSLSLPQVLVICAFLLAWSGFRAFLSCPPLPTGLVLVCVALTLAVVTTAELSASIELRTTFNALVIGAFSFLIAADLFRLSPSLTGRLTAVVYGLNGLFFALRFVTLLRSPMPAVPMFSDGMAAAALLWLLAFTIGTTLGMVLLAGARLQGHLDDLASRDPLTGTLNRRAFSKSGERELARARRHGHPVAALMMDLDHFKRINDELGHAAGDYVLRRFVDVATTCLRCEDLLGRHGGEEFAALLPETSLKEAVSAAERLRKALTAKANRDQHALAPRWPVTVSIGIAEWHPEQSLEDLLTAADEALYAAKHAGRDRCETAPGPVETSSLSA